LPKFVAEAARTSGNGETDARSPGDFGYDREANSEILMPDLVARVDRRALVPFQCVES
jgi:hypothetical protein